jgi:hypothetical protein
MIKLLENVNLFLSMASAVSISGAANCGILRQLLFEDPGKQSFVLACNEYACNDQYIQPAAKPVTENQIVVRRRAETSAHKYETTRKDSGTRPVHS